MKKVFSKLVDTAKGRHCQVIPFTEDFKHSMGAQLTSQLNNDEYLANNPNGGLQDFKRDTEMVGQVTRNKTDEEIQASIAQFSNQNALVSQRLLNIPAQIFQIVTCRQLLAANMKIDNPNLQNPQWKLNDSRIRYSKNSVGEIFINLSFNVYAYQNTAMPLEGYCLTDQGKIVEVNSAQLSQLTSMSQEIKSQFLDYANQQLHLNLVPFFEIRARIKMKPGLENAFVYEYVDLALEINHPSITYAPSQSVFEELDTEEMIRTKNYHQLEEEDQLAVERDQFCQVIPFTQEYRRSLSDYLTQSYRKGAPYFVGKANQGYPDFQRDVEMIGQTTVGKSDAEVAESIKLFSAENIQIRDQLSQVAGQAYQIDMNGLILQNLKVNNIDEDAAWNFQCKDSTIRYSKNTQGEVFLNLHYSIYAVLVSGRKTEGYCLSDQGKLVKFSEATMNKLRGTEKAHFKTVARDELGINIVPLTAIRARIKLIPNAETNTITYECVDLAISINHPSISYESAVDQDRIIDAGVQELDFAHVTATTSYDKLEEIDQAAIQNDRPYQVIPFTEEFRNALAAQYTELYNSDQYRKQQAGFNDFNRTAEIVGETTRNQPQDVIDASIRRYSGNYDLVATQLRYVIGQSYMSDLQIFIMNNLYDSSSNSNIGAITWGKDSNQMRYTSDEHGNKYFNLQMNIYGYQNMSSPEEIHCLSADGEMIILTNAEADAEQERSEHSLKDPNAPKPNIMPIISLRARIKLRPEEASKKVVYEIPELEIAINHPGLQLSEAGQRALNFNAATRSANPYELYQKDQATVEADIAGFARYSAPPADLPRPQPKAAPPKTTPGFFTIPVEQDSEVEAEFVPAANAVPDLETREEYNGPLPQGGSRNVRPRFDAPDTMDRSQFDLLTPFQQYVVRSAHQHSPIRYRSHDQHSITLRDAENPAATTDQYNVKVTGNGDQWTIQSQHLDSSTKLANALIESNPDTIITIVSKRGPTNDVNAIKNDLEALIRLTAKGTLVDIADDKMGYLKAHLNNANIIEEMRTRFASDPDLIHFMSRVHNVPLHAFIDELFRMQNEALNNATSSHRPGM